MSAVEVARQELAIARAEHSRARNSSPNERERCRLAVVRAEGRLANAEWAEAQR